MFHKIVFILWYVKSLKKCNKIYWKIFVKLSLAFHDWMESKNLGKWAKISIARLEAFHFSSLKIEILTSKCPFGGILVHFVVVKSQIVIKVLPLSIP